MVAAIIFGVIGAFNMLVILIKYKMGRYSDAILDGGILFLLNSMAAGTVTGMMVATIASFIVSIFLFFIQSKKRKGVIHAN